MNYYNNIPEPPIDPPEKPLPEIPCPVCGSYDAETFYYSKESGTYVGCDRCIEEKDYWDVFDEVYNDHELI